MSDKKKFRWDDLPPLPVLIYCGVILLVILGSAFVGVVKFLAYWRIAFGK